MAKSTKKNLPVEIVHNELYDIVTKLMDYIGDKHLDSKSLSEKIASISSDITRILDRNPSETSSFVSEKLVEISKRFIEYRNSERYSKFDEYNLIREFSSYLISSIKSKYTFTKSPDSIVINLVKDLIQFLSYQCNDSRDLSVKIDDKLISKLIPEYNDIEAVNAFYRLFIKPIIGTRRAIQSIFDIVGENGRPVEWFNNGLQEYHYAIEYSTIPEDIDIDRIIELAEWLKNERSHLLTIRTPLCGYPFRWDYTKWDKDQWDNVEGVKWKNTNVYVCFSTKNSGYDFFKFDPYQMTTLFDSQQSNYIFSNYHSYDEFFWDNFRRGEFVNQFISYSYLNRARWSRPAISYPIFDKKTGLFLPRTYLEDYDFIERNLPLLELPIVNHDFFLSPNGNEYIEYSPEEKINYMYTMDYISHWRSPASWTRDEFYRVEIAPGVWIKKSRKVWNADDLYPLEWDTFDWDNSLLDDEILRRMRDRLLLTAINNVFLVTGLINDDDDFKLPFVHSDESLAYSTSHVFRKDPIVNIYKSKVIECDPNDEYVEFSISSIDGTDSNEWDNLLWDKFNEFEISYKTVFTVDRIKLNFKDDDIPLTEFVEWLGGTVDYTSNMCGISTCGVGGCGLIPFREDLPIETVTTPYHSPYDISRPDYITNIVGVATTGHDVVGNVYPNTSPANTASSNIDYNPNLPDSDSYVIEKVEEEVIQLGLDDIDHDDILWDNTDSIIRRYTTYEYNIWEGLGIDGIYWDQEDWDSEDLERYLNQPEYISDNPNILYLYYNLNKNKYNYPSLDDREYEPFEKWMYTHDYVNHDKFTLHPRFHRPPSEWITENTDSTPDLPTPTPTPIPDPIPDPVPNPDLYPDQEFAPLSIYDDVIWDDLIYDHYKELISKEEIFDESNVFSDSEGVSDDSNHTIDNPYNPEIIDSFAEISIWDETNQDYLIYDNNKVYVWEGSSDPVSPHEVSNVVESSVSPISSGDILSWDNYSYDNSLYDNDSELSHGHYNYVIKTEDIDPHTPLVTEPTDVSGSPILTDKNLITDTFSSDWEDELPLKWQMFTWDYILNGQIFGEDGSGFNYRILHTLDHIHHTRFEYPTPSLIFNIEGRAGKARCGKDRIGILGYCWDFAFDQSTEFDNRSYSVYDYTYLYFSRPRYSVKDLIIESDGTVSVDLLSKSELGFKLIEYLEREKVNHYNPSYNNGGIEFQQVMHTHDYISSNVYMRHPVLVPSYDPYYDYSTVPDRTIWDEDFFYDRDLYSAFDNIPPALNADTLTLTDNNSWDDGFAYDSNKVINWNSGEPEPIEPGESDESNESGLIDLESDEYESNYIIDVDIEADALTIPDNNPWDNIIYDRNEVIEYETGSESNEESESASNLIIDVESNEVESNSESNEESNYEPEVELLDSQTITDDNPWDDLAYDRNTTVEAESNESESNFESNAIESNEESNFESNYEPDLELIDPETVIDNNPWDYLAFDKAVSEESNFESNESNESEFESNESNDVIDINLPYNEISLLDNSPWDDINYDTNVLIDNSVQVSDDNTELIDLRTVIDNNVWDEIFFDRNTPTDPESNNIIDIESNESSSESSYVIDIESNDESGYSPDIYRPDYYDLISIIDSGSWDSILYDEGVIELESNDESGHVIDLESNESGHESNEIDLESNESNYESNYIIDESNNVSPVDESNYEPESNEHTDPELVFDPAFAIDSISWDNYSFDVYSLQEEEESEGAESNYESNEIDLESNDDDYLLIEVNVYSPFFEFENWNLSNKLIGTEEWIDTKTLKETNNRINLPVIYQNFIWDYPLNYRVSDTFDSAKVMETYSYLTNLKFRYSSIFRVENATRPEGSYPEVGRAQCGVCELNTYGDYSVVVEHPISESFDPIDKVARFIIPVPETGIAECGLSEINTRYISTSTGATSLTLIKKVTSYIDPNTPVMEGDGEFDPYGGYPYTSNFSSGIVVKAEWGDRHLLVEYTCHSLGTVGILNFDYMRVHAGYFAAGASDNQVIRYPSDTVIDVHGESYISPNENISIDLSPELMTNMIAEYGKYSAISHVVSSNITNTNEIEQIIDASITLHENHEVKVIENAAFYNDERIPSWNIIGSSDPVIEYSSLSEARFIPSKFDIDVDGFFQPFRLDDPRFSNVDIDTFTYRLDLEDDSGISEYSIDVDRSPKVAHIDIRNLKTDDIDGMSGSVDDIDIEDIDILPVGADINLLDYFNISPEEFEESALELESGEELDISLDQDQDLDNYDLGEAGALPDIDMDTLMVHWDVDYGYIDVDQNSSYIITVDSVYTYIHNSQMSSFNKTISFSNTSVYQNIHYEAA